VCWFQYCILFFFFLDLRNVDVMHFCHAVRARSVGLDVAWRRNSCQDRFLVTPSTLVAC
jgi:hypothetical protein